MKYKLLICLGAMCYNSAYAVKQHSNVVEIYPYNKDGTSIMLSDFYQTKYSVTSGQPYAGSFFSSPNMIVVKSGRSGSTTPVQWLKNNGYTVKSDPGKLNFAVMGNIKFTVNSPVFNGQLVCNDVALAQGHRGSSNDWWFYDNLKDYPSMNFGANYFHDLNKITYLSCHNISNANQKFYIQVSSINLPHQGQVNRFNIGGIAKPDWMARIQGSKSLNQIAMPGSHDAGMEETRNCFMSPVYSKTQNINIFKQAVVGSRYFDIRPDYDKNILTTYHRGSDHNMGCSGQPMEDVLDQSLAFLTRHPTETLILKISHTRTSGGKNPEEIAQRVIGLLQQPKYQGRIFKSTVTNYPLARLSLDQLRGKMLIVFGDGYYQKYRNPENGFFQYTDFGRNYNNALQVYDKYSDTSSSNTMINDQLSKLSSYGGLGKDYLFLLSWTLTGLGSIEVFSNYVNPDLPYYLDLIKKGRYPMPNIVYLDFIDTKLGYLITTLNP